MTQLTNYGENKFCDFIRGQAMGLPGAWHFALGSLADDGTFTELAGTSYARVPITRSLGNFAGTQGAGTTLASSGTTHVTSNNVLIDWGTVGSGGWGTVDAIGLFDASTGGNCWIYAARDSLLLSAGDTYSLAAGVVAFALGKSGGMSDYLSNKMIDLVFRAQAFTFPTSMFHALYSALPTNAGGGTEFSAPSYERAELPCSLTAISGTQSAGSVVASTGTDGKVSNNVPVVHPDPDEDWGIALGGGWRDATTLGNLLFWGAFAAARSIFENGSAPSYDAGKATFAFD